MAEEDCTQGGVFIGLSNLYPVQGEETNVDLDELASSIARTTATARRDGGAPPDRQQLAARLRQPEWLIKRALELLEKRESARPLLVREPKTAPDGTASTQHQPQMAGVDTKATEGALTVLVRSTAWVFRAALNIDLKPVGRAACSDQVTTEDISTFVRVTGDLEGSVCFGVDRIAAHRILGAVARRHVGKIDAAGLSVLNQLAERVAAAAQAELSKTGCSIDVSLASSVYPVGMKITTHGVPQSVVTLAGPPGPIAVHVVLREVPQDDSLAA